jgi:spermidine synthase
VSVSRRAARTPLLAAFVGGVASMGLEVVAARVVAPVYGASVYVWGSILVVFMLALSAGYYAGGRLAARDASRRRLGGFLLVAAALVGVVAVGSRAVLDVGLALPVAPRYQSLLPLFVLFGPPAAVVGFVSPYAAELVAEESAGDAAGRAYAAGTLGSIVGAAGTTFVLVPRGSVALSYGVFVAALALGGVLVAPGLRRAAAVGVLVAALATVAATSPPVAPGLPGGETVHETDTAYHHLTVRDDGGVRYLVMNGDYHSARYTDGRSGYVFAYQALLHVPTLYGPAPDEIDRVLVIGGGGGRVSGRYAAEYDARVDVVELDPEVARVARTYFGATDPDVTWHVGDGRRYLRETDRTYDVVVVDAFRQDGVPYHLLTAEFAGLARERLADDGVLAYNLISPYAGGGSDLWRAEARTLGTRFGRVDAYATAAERPGRVQNVVVVARDGAPLSTARLRERAATRAVGVPTDRLALDSRRADVTPVDVPVFRDDRGSAAPYLRRFAGEPYLTVQTDGTGAPNGTATPQGESGETRYSARAVRSIPARASAADRSAPTRA